MFLGNNLKKLKYGEWVVEKDENAGFYIFHRDHPETNKIIAKRNITFIKIIHTGIILIYTTMGNHLMVGSLPEWFIAEMDKKIFSNELKEKYYGTQNPN